MRTLPWENMILPFCARAFQFPMTSKGMRVFSGTFTCWKYCYQIRTQIKCKVFTPQPSFHFGKTNRKSRNVNTAPVLAAVAIYKWRSKSNLNMKVQGTLAYISSGNCSPSVQITCTSSITGSSFLFDKLVVGTECDLPIARDSFNVHLMPSNTACLH